MTDVFTPEQRSAVMARVKARDTGPERALRRALHARGLRYRLHVEALPGRPDIVFSRPRVVVFIHGCFWHGHDCKRGARAPRSNAAYWSAKIARNRTRDAAQAAALAAAGWRVEAVWTCEMTGDAALNAVADRLTALIRNIAQ
jgi:DNA mismatch endonuclease, patch repair protein